MVPPEKDPLPKHGRLLGVARLLGVLGFIAYATIIAAIMADHPGLWENARFVWVAVVGLVCFGLTWHNGIMGGALLVAAMVLDGFLIPTQLLGWRVFAQACTLYLCLVGLLFLIAGRNRK